MLESVSLDFVVYSIGICVHLPNLHSSEAFLHYFGIMNISNCFNFLHFRIKLDNYGLGSLVSVIYTRLSNHLLSSI